MARSYKVRSWPKALKRLRRKLVLSQRELAALVGVSPGLVGAWESRRDAREPGGPAAALLGILLHRVDGFVGEPEVLVAHGRGALGMLKDQERARVLDLLQRRLGR